MTASSRLIARLAKLPRAHTRDIQVEVDLPAVMSDGAVLLADRYHSRGDGKNPIILIRSPYGRKLVVGMLGRLFAERGYQVVIQSCRGTFGSDGGFDGLHAEGPDGRATLDWLAAQPWFGGKVGMFGSSYIGYAQWAVAADAPPQLQALTPSVTASNFRPSMYPGESFALDTLATWIHLMSHQEEPIWRVIRGQLRQRRTLRTVFQHLPLAEVDGLATGRTVTHYQDWLAHNEPGDPYWVEVDHSRHLESVRAPVSLLGGWYDLFLPQQLADFERLQAAGADVRITVGPWTHVALGNIGASLRDALEWFDAHLGDGVLQPRAPVRVFVMGANRWLDLDRWPPPAEPQPWFLQPHAVLARQAAPVSPPDRYRYDPAHPTPSLGGIVLGPHAGARDNRGLEARSDVLVYTSAPLIDDLEIVGPVHAELYVRSSLEHADFFVRLCDVHPRGRSINICDGAVRLLPGRWQKDADGVAKVHVELWPTAHRFLTAHRVRLQVSSGAHPRIARNLGSGEPLASGSTMMAADQQVFHDPEHLSAVVLPVTGARLPT